jgi:hypothetical protein
VTKLGRFLTPARVERQAPAVHRFGVPTTRDASGILDKYFDQAILRTVVK